MKDAYYFSHDANARNDPKILAMRSIYGAAGYGWFWIIVEMLREQDNYRLPLDKYTGNALAMQMQCTPEEARKFIEDCINEFHLFASDGEYFWSDSLCRRMAQYDAKAIKARKAAQARWEKERNEQNKKVNKIEPDSPLCDCNADAMQMQCDRNASKVKESKSTSSLEEEKGSIANALQGQCGCNADAMQSQCGCITKEDERKIAQFVVNEFIPGAGPFQVERLCSWVKEGMEADAIIYAMEVALLANVRRVDYVEAVLRDWFAAGIRTRAQAEAKLAERQTRTKDKSGGVVYADLTKKLAELDA